MFARTQFSDSIIYAVVTFFSKNKLHIVLKGTVMQTEKTLRNDRLRVSKVS